MKLRERMSKSNSKRFALVLSLLLVFFLFVPHVSAYENGYYIDTYDVDITVNEDNTFEITEKLRVHYDEGANKHGIVRAIPLTNYVERADGSTNVNRVDISDVWVDTNYTTYEEDGEYCIRIGSASTYVQGDVDYVIKYTYDIGRDPILTDDEFYFNIIGTGWDTSIMSTDFTVRFPKEFTWSKDTLGFSHGYQGTGNYEGVTFRVENNTVYGYYHEELKAHQGLNMRLLLPEGYFVRGLSIWDYLGYVGYALPFLGFFFIYYLYQRFAKNDVIVEPVEFYPPDKMNPMEVGFYYDDYVNTKDITTLLIYLATKGCLSIEEFADTYKIHMLKYPSGENQEVRTFYDGLMSYADETDTVYEEELKERFYRTIDRVRSGFDESGRRKKLIVPVGGYKFLGIISGLLSVFFSVYMVVYANTYDFSASLGISMMAAFLSMFVTTFAAAILKSVKRRFLAVLLLLPLLIFVGAFGFMTYNFFGPMLTRKPLILILGAIGLLLGIGTFIIVAKMGKRTPFGNEVLGRVRGFRHFLDTAEKNQLEMLVEEDPTYFYDILPYAYVLGVSSKWIRKFDGIAMEPPQWYYGYDDPMRINSRIDHTYNDLSSTMHSSPEPTYSSSGSSGGSSWTSSGSSGGGFSGGGSGGGGGHSW